MKRKIYEKQVDLLLQILPEVAKEKMFAIHGGTAINLFVRDMPRLSVDIDLTYIPIQDRSTSLANISEGLLSIASNIKKIIPNVHIDVKEKDLKLIVNASGIIVKVEVSIMNRGIYGDLETRVLCDKAQNTFEAFCEIQSVSLGQLYGGKICAALDRQHPRDIFDVKLLMENEGFTQEIEEGFLMLLLCSERPIHEMLSPNLLDQSKAFEQQFEGMTSEAYTYEDYEAIRLNLIKIINDNLTGIDKQLLLNFKNISSEWNDHPFSQFPGVKWKQLNLKKLKVQNPEKHQQLVIKLKEVLNVKEE
ncbi:MAG: nucleotidyl transferase AbiEii/AbiGii toxin family protein [Sphingobacterium sp.]